MSYIIEQKIKGRIYLYKVESYWDKDKKQARQKRVYIGPKDKRTNSELKPVINNLITKNYGNILLLDHIINEIGLDMVIRSSFPENYKEIIALAYYEIMEASASYLFPYWLEEQNLQQVKKLHSSDISSLMEVLGKDQQGRKKFTQQWIEHLAPIQGIYYDITSVSSYSTKIDYIEWGYNRDNENLPQLNIGLVCCQSKGLPFFYNIFPGSIVDVTTIKNFIKYLKVYGLQDMLLIMDRGFFSTANILGLNNGENRINFIQPLSFSLKKAKELIKQNRKELTSTKTAIKYNGEIIHHVLAPITFEKEQFQAHLYLNEKAELDHRHIFLSRLLDIESKHKDKQFKTLEEFQVFQEAEIAEKNRDFFKWNRNTLAVEINITKVNEHVSNLGYFIIVTNLSGLQSHQVLDYYRDKDKVEKIFDVVKNEMDGERIRSHSRYNAEGKLFVKFIALIIYMQITSIMRKNKLFEKYSFQELIREVKKNKITYFENYDPIISEISKKQKVIFDAFKIKYQ